MGNAETVPDDDEGLDGRKYHDLSANHMRRSGVLSTTAMRPPLQLLEHPMIQRKKALRWRTLIRCLVSCRQAAVGPQRRLCTQRVADESGIWA